jgi:hypothetical protein
MVNIEVKLVFSTVMSIFAFAVWVVNRPLEKSRLIDWMDSWVPRFDFSDDQIGKSVIRPLYIGFFLIWIPIVWLFD